MRRQCQAADGEKSLPIDTKDIDYSLPTSYGTQNHHSSGLWKSLKESTIFCVLYNSVVVGVTARESRT